MSCTQTSYSASYAVSQCLYALVARFEMHLIISRAHECTLAMPAFELFREVHLERMVFTAFAHAFLTGPHLTFSPSPTNFHQRFHISIHHITEPTSASLRAAMPAIVLILALVCVPIILGSIFATAGYKAYRARLLFEQEDLEHAHGIDSTRHGTANAIMMRALDPRPIPTLKEEIKGTGGGFVLTNNIPTPPRIYNSSIYCRYNNAGSPEDTKAADAWKKIERREPLVRPHTAEFEEVDLDPGDYGAGSRGQAVANRPSWSTQASNASRKVSDGEGELLPETASCGASSCQSEAVGARVSSEIGEEEQRRKSMAATMARLEGHASQIFGVCSNMT